MGLIVAYKIINCDLCYAKNTEFETHKDLNIIRGAVKNDYLLHIRIAKQHCCQLSICTERKESVIKYRLPSLVLTPEGSTKYKLK